MLLNEMRLMLESHPTANLETLYVGGGTPTSLSAKQLDRLLSGAREILPFQNGNEFTVEANPGDLTREKLQVMKNYGVNRLSMGVQTFDNRLLKKLDVNILQKMCIKQCNFRSRKFYQCKHRFDLCITGTNTRRISGYFGKSFGFGSASLFFVLIDPRKQNNVHELGTTRKTRTA